MIELIKILLILILLWHFPMQAKGYEPAEYLQYEVEIRKFFAEEMKKEFGLVCIGEGGSMPYDVEEIDVNFICYKRGTIEEARKLEIHATERLVKRINEHEKISPFLRERPFKPNRGM
jgi:hypothetical protein